MAKKPRYRLRYTFWLNHLDTDHVAVADTIERLKNQRSFATVVREGIMIVNELRQGRADLLFKLYPWAADLVKQTTPPAPNNSDLERQIADLKQIIMQQGSIGAPPKDYPLLKPASAPIIQAKAAPLADASAIADNFLAFIQ